MKTDEFSDLIRAIRQLDHHQRKILSIALGQIAEASQAIELIESHFDSVAVCPRAETTSYIATVQHMGFSAIFAAPAT